MFLYFFPVAFLIYFSDLNSHGFKLSEYLLTSTVNKQGKVLAISLGVFSTKVKKKENFLLKKMKLTPDI